MNPTNTPPWGPQRRGQDSGGPVCCLERRSMRGSTQSSPRDELTRCPCYAAEEGFILLSAAEHSALKATVSACVGLTLVVCYYYYYCYYSGAAKPPLESLMRGQTVKVGAPQLEFVARGGYWSIQVKQNNQIHKQLLPPGRQTAKLPPTPCCHFVHVSNDTVHTYIKFSDMKVTFLQYFSVYIAAVFTIYT